MYELSKKAKTRSYFINSGQPETVICSIVITGAPAMALDKRQGLELFQTTSRRLQTLPRSLSARRRVLSICAFLNNWYDK